MGRVELMADEAIVLTRYKDSAGIWTIGVGVTDAAGASIKPTRFKGEITLKQAVNMFERVLIDYENAVNAIIKVPLLQHEFDALVSFHYNTGQIKAGTVDNKINAGDKEGAMKTLLRYNKKRNPKTGKLEVSQGLVKRRNSEKHLFETGLYGNGFVSVYKANSAGKVLWGTGKRVNALKLLGVPDQTEKLKEVAMDAAAVDRRPTTKYAAEVVGISSAIGTGSQVVEQVREAQSIWETVISASPWVLLTVVCIAGAIYIWKERDRKELDGKGALS